MIAPTDTQGPEWDWIYMLPGWEFYQRALSKPRPYPGWDRDENDEPCFVMLELTRGTGNVIESRSMAVEWDDITEGEFYYRDWTSSGIPTVDEGEAYWAGFWFQRKTDAVKFQEEFGGVGNWMEEFPAFQRRCNERRAGQ
jgi:hypothetical protein